MNLRVDIRYEGSSQIQQTRLSGMPAVLDASDIEQVSLYLPVSDVLAYERIGDDLILRLSNGTQVRLQDFFDAEGDEPILRLAESDPVAATPVDFLNLQFPDAPQGMLHPVLAGSGDAGTAAAGALGLAAVALGGAAVALGSGGGGDSKSDTDNGSDADDGTRGEEGGGDGKGNGNGGSDDDDDTGNGNGGGDDDDDGTGKGNGNGGDDDDDGAGKGDGNGGGDDEDDGAGKGNGNGNDDDEDDGTGKGNGNGDDEDDDGTGKGNGNGGGGDDDDDGAGKGNGNGGDDDDDGAGKGNGNGGGDDDDGAGKGNGNGGDDDDDDGKGNGNGGDDDDDGAGKGNGNGGGDDDDDGAGNGNGGDDDDDGAGKGNGDDDDDGAGDDDGKGNCDCEQNGGEPNGPAPIIDDVNPFKITGTSGTGVSVLVINETTGQIVGEATIDQETGEYTVDLNHQCATGDEISILTVDSEGNAVSKSAEATVQAAPAYVLSDSPDFSSGTLKVYKAEEDATFSKNSIETEFNQDVGSVDEGHGGRDWARTTALGDFNGDGIKDYLFAIHGYYHSGETAFRIHLGNGDGTFSADPVAFARKGEPAGQDWRKASLVSDVNNDGIDDYVFSMQKNGDTTIDVYLGQNEADGEGLLSTDVISTTIDGHVTGQDYTQTTHLADVNGDGSMDYIYAGGSKPAITVSLGKGDGSFETDLITTELPRSMTGLSGSEASFFADFDGDGSVDYLFSEEVGHDTVVRMYRGTGDGKFSQSSIKTTLNGSSSGESGSETTHVIDVSQDGNVDYVHIKGSTAQVYLGEGDGSFATSAKETEFPADAASGVSFLKTGLLENLFSEGPRTQTGTSEDDRLIGNDAQDRLIGHGGGDTLSGSGGDDHIFVADADFAKVDGGAGTDTLALSGGKIDLDFSKIENDVVKDIEIIDITGNGANTLALSSEDVAALLDTQNRELRIDGDGDDKVELSNFQKSELTDNIDGTEYDIYTCEDVVVLVDSSISNVVAQDTTETVLG